MIKNEERQINIGLIDKNHGNPNRMKPKAFDLLIDNIQKHGFLENVVVRPMEDGRYRMVSGHHRLEAAQYLGMKEVPATVIMNPDFDQEEEDMLLVRMNMIKGELDPNLFFSLYQKYENKYGDAVLRDSFGFADEAEWKRLVNQLAKQLPDEDTQKKFKQAAKELKSIDDLSALLNKMFSLYGDSTPYGYMVFDYGGNKQMWIQSSSKTMKAAEALGNVCKEASIYMDDLIAQIFAHMMSPNGAETLKNLVEKTDKADLPEHLIGVPTKEKVAQTNEFDNV